MAIKFTRDPIPGNGSKKTLSQDEYGEVYNSPQTSQGIADLLNSNGSVVIGWTDEAGSHLDILFCIQPVQVGQLQRGMSAHTDLFVGLSHFGMFGFDITNQNGSDAGYVGEKLGIPGDNITTKKLAQLINEVRQKLKESA